MSDNGNGENIQSQTIEISPSVMIVQFEAEGKAAFQARLNNVTPAQLSAFSVWLDWYLKRTFDAQAAVQEANKIQIPQ